MKHLIFDCGGVLVYPRLGDWSIPLGLPEALGARAGDIGSPRYMEAHRQSARWLDESRVVLDMEAERRMRTEYIRSMNALMGWQLAPAEVVRLADNFTENPRRYGCFDDVSTWLERWKAQYSLGVLSDAMPSILNFMDSFGILAPFDAVVISTRVGATKPDPRMYAAVLNALDADPADCLFVDDRVSNLEGAMAAGMGAVQMARAEFPPAFCWEGPLVHDFEELNRWIES